MAATAQAEPRRCRPPSSMRPDRARRTAPWRSATKPRSRPASSRTAHQRRRAMARQNVDEYDLAAGSLDDLVADDLFAGVVAALDQHARRHLRDQADRRVLLEDRDEIDRLQRRQHFGPRPLVLNRAPLAFQSFHRGIAVETDDQAVAGAARGRQHLDVAGMQDVEAAIGEPYA